MIKFYNDGTWEEKRLTTSIERLPEEYLITPSQSTLARTSWGTPDSIDSVRFVYNSSSTNTDWT